jgi:hypothetical protein
MADISRKGIFQGDLVTLLKLIKTNLNGIMTHLDADTGVTDANYNTLWALTLPDVSVEAAGTGAGTAIVIDFLRQAFTNYNGVIAKLNLDAGITAVDFAVLTTPVGENLAIFAGMNQTDEIDALQTLITGIATLTAKLDADGDVNSTDYAATYDVDDTVDDSGQ